MRVGGVMWGIGWAWNMWWWGTGKKRYPILTITKETRWVVGQYTQKEQKPRQNLKFCIKN